jgi:hypothetical protein
MYDKKPYGVRLKLKNEGRKGERAETFNSFLNNYFVHFKLKWLTIFLA